MQLFPISKIKLKYKCIMCYTCNCTKPVLQAVWLLSDCMLATWRGGGGEWWPWCTKEYFKKNCMVMFQPDTSAPEFCISVSVYLRTAVSLYLCISASLYPFISLSCTPVQVLMISWGVFRKGGGGGLELSLLGRTCFHRSCIRWTALYRVAYRVLCPPTMYSGSRVRLRFRSLPSGPVEDLLAVCKMLKNLSKL